MIFLYKFIPKQDEVHKIFVSAKHKLIASHSESRVLDYIFLESLMICTAFLLNVLYNLSKGSPSFAIPYTGHHWDQDYAEPTVLSNETFFFLLYLRSIFQENTLIRKAVNVIRKNGNTVRFAWCFK